MPVASGHFGVPPATREDSLPTLLSETGLYTDIQSKQLNSVILGYTPEFQFWSDGAEKSRWVYVPECDSVDSSDMNDWRLPVGARLWKEFSLDGVRIETRLIERLGTGARDFAYASYLWNEDESEAERVGPEGLADAKGTGWEIPSLSGCFQCHGEYAFGGGRPSRALGFSALQLAHKDTPLTLEQLVESGKLSHPPEGEISFPGSSLEREAIGYLHANCGNCHNASEDGLPQTDLNLWIELGLTSVEELPVWQTAVDQPTVLFKDQHISGRIVPGDPAGSALLYRMSQRGNAAQMPPLASKVVDEEGIALIQAWIESL